MVSISVGVIYYNITLTMIIVTDDSLTYPYELRHVGLYQLASVWQFISFEFSQQCDAYAAYSLGAVQITALYIIYRDNLVIFVYCYIAT